MVCYMKTNICFQWYLVCCDIKSIDDLYDEGPEVGHTCHVNEVHLYQQQIALNPFLCGTL